ncbi:ferredoxin--NADP+ reductase [Saccharomonospora amisosensis]|uniref:ferredoxin--NADP(+) reductase n=1 Tax=Saccharomonospora amisosensis TaxID=1128677 RepID=A0A7X5UPR7_9PSEU|nr:FAD-dependent oxidoreductase [Saccharomonospora amisosensis]NIJ11942.1 ferredoxin--NADP+ reductase [Saccharomonospora amisosensis]
MTSHRLRVAVVGSGPAGVYATDALLKSTAAVETDLSIDLFERLPAPYGLIRYGVAPDHPRIKGAVSALARVLARPRVRLFGNVTYGTDLNLDDLRGLYHAVIFATGANQDRRLRIPGIDLAGSHGAAEFVAWYDGHPDAPRTWPLRAEQVAVVGAGNVALDVARILAKTADELLPTDIPPNVYSGLRANRATDIHVFGRRGPAQAKFTPLELRELDHSPTVEVVVDPEGIRYDDASVRARRQSKQVDLVAATLEDWAIRDTGSRPHRIHLHFFEEPTELLGENGHVVGLRTQRTELCGDGKVRGTGRFRDWDVQAVYRAVGYLSEPVAKLPFDDESGTVPNEAGRVLGVDGAPLPATYVTGWVKRGPVGLIGHTKGDANETVACLLDDHASGRLPTPAAAEPEAILALLAAKGADYTTWAGWQRLDAHERDLGKAQGRERIKVVDRAAMTRISSEPVRASD